MQILRLARVPVWLRRALGIQAGDVPADLYADVIVGVLDLFQGGHGIARYRTYFESRAQNEPAIALSVVPANPELARTIYGLRISRTGGGAAAEVGLVLFDLAGQQQQDVGRASIAVGGRLSLTQLTQGAYPIFVPPGWAAAIDLPATAAGESYDIDIMVAEVGAGFRPL